MKDKDTKEKYSTQEEEVIIDNTNNTKKSSGKKYYKIILITLLVLSVCVGLYTLSNVFDVNLNLNTISTNSKNKSQIELKYTDVVKDSDSSGIYITDVSEIVENAMPMVVAITSETLISSGQFGPLYFGQNQYSEGAGSGIIISQSDTELMILTNYHVVEDTDSLSVQFINEKSYSATIKGVSERKDIAVIAVKLSDIDSDTLDSIKIATIGSSDDLKVGNGVIAIGNALGYGQSVTTGIVSALHREVTIDDYTNEMIQIDAAINGGNSGGALLNSRGEVVGINSAKYSSSGSSTSASIEGMGFAIPISDVTDLITELMNGNDDDSEVTIGVEGYIITSSYSKVYNIPQGFYISKIVSGSGADNSSLEIGYIITEIDGQDVENLSDITNVLYKHKKGDKITLTVSYPKSHNYEEKEVEITLS